MNRLKIEDGKLHFYCRYWDDNGGSWVIADNLLFDREKDTRRCYELFDHKVGLVVDYDIIEEYENLTKQEKLTLLEYLKIRVQNENN